MEIQNENALANFMYALKAPETRRKYPQRLKLFFDFVLGNGKDLNVQATEFVKKAMDNDLRNGLWNVISSIMFLPRNPLSCDNPPDNLIR